MTRHILAALLLASVALPAALPAQTVAESITSLRPSTRVRLTAPTVARRRITGPIQNATPDTVFVTTYGGLVPVPMGAITAADVSLGRDHWKGMRRGALRGGAIGGVGLAVLVFAGDPNCDYCLPGQNLEAAVAGALIGVILGAPTGALIGGIKGFEEWEPLYPVVRVRVTPILDGRAGIGFSLTRS